MPRLSELRYGVTIEGAKVKMHTIEGALLNVTGLGFIEDDEWPGVVVVFGKGEDKRWFTCFSKIVLETLQDHADHVPFECMFLKHESAAGRTFWTVE